jgi:putative ABC transport system ATP-binding protein
VTEAPLISVENLTRHYVVGEEEVRALDGVSFDVRRGEWVAVVGQSGSGKSTLMNLIGALDTPTSGSYRINGHDVEKLSDDALADLRNNEIGFVFQTFQLLSRSTALANVELPLVYRGVSRKERRERAEKALEAVGLSNRMHHRPNELSGGQRQRVAIARALVGNPSLLLADEPTGNLDSATGEEIIRLFGELHRRGHTILLVTHEPKLAARCPRAIRLSDGKVVADGPGSEVAVLGVPAATAAHPSAPQAGAAA